MDCSMPGFPVPHHLLELPKFMPVASVMSFYHLILCCPLLCPLRLPFTALSHQKDLHNSMKLWVMPCRGTQDGWIIVESSDKTWSTGGRNSKPPVNLPWEPHELYKILRSGSFYGKQKKFMKVIGTPIITHVTTFSFIKWASFHKT